MYIARVRIQGYLCHKDTTIDFQQGVNVIIGENNAGKTALVRSLGLVFDRKHRRSLQLFDFYQGINDFTKAPEITVTVTLRSCDTDTQDDKALVALWLTTLNHPWEAQLSY